MGLTENQKKAVMAGEGNWLINAGSGSGKTTVFTTRIARMIKEGEAIPEEILGLTFTKEAATNMKKKLSKLIGKKQADKVDLLTFHSFAYSILKRKYPLKYRQLQLMPMWWKMKTLNDFCAKPSNFNPEGMSLMCKAGDLASFISYQKMNMVDPGGELLIDMRTENVASVSVEDLGVIYAKYCDMQEKARLIEFDDMLLDLYHKLEEDPKLATYIANQYSYIMVDEFQDTNKVSMGILSHISNENIFAVGDFRQGIYGFINASISNILDFEDTFENVNNIELKHNFRSTKNIVGISNKIIDMSPIEKYKNFEPQVAGRKEEGSNIEFNVYRDEAYEVKDIANQIIDLVESGENVYEDFAILLRTNAQLGIYESVFSSQEIPVDVSSDRSFFDRREISDLLAYAEHTLDPNDDSSFRKVYNSPSRFISNQVQKSIDEYAYKHEVNLEEAAIRADIGKSGSVLSSYVDLFDDLRDIVDDVRADSFLIEVYKRTNYKKHVENTSTTAVDLEMRLEAINSLFEIAKKFRSVNAFLAHIMAVKQNNSKTNEHAVRLMTAHASKGLEFKHVFFPAFTSENYPHKMNPDIEEERRLSYVVASRAVDKLTVSMPNFISDGGSKYDPSPFLVDIAGDEIKDLQKNVTRGDSKSNLSISFL
ncbi:ATP-dependent helicase [Vagococcus elongatus]|uniref:DNA 3'-5' helicase n=1 Tax=Vagococcus elongatus TaxID=180344 RepID=A0A430AW88_9ENTE|nr:ATP-dependent helicase [Vagococcus elongatus]RSU12315.1 hypothetical protein CBF29_06855 [Vagococcus elongatus]